jgi:hypothetical protein
MLYVERPKKGVYYPGIVTCDSAGGGVGSGSSSDSAKAEVGCASVDAV